MKRILTTIAFVALGAAVGVAADPKAGKEAYDKSCKSCHGPDGTPNAAVAKMMKVEMKPLGSADVQGQSEADIAKTITGGKGKMVPVKGVAPAAAADVAAYVKTLKK